MAQKTACDSVTRTPVTFASLQVGDLFHWTGQGYGKCYEYVVQENQNGVAAPFIYAMRMPRNGSLARIHRTSFQANRAQWMHHGEQLDTYFAKQIRKSRKPAGP